MHGNKVKNNMYKDKKQWNKECNNHKNYMLNNH
jgi:hypothetical protein